MVTKKLNSQKTNPSTFRKTKQIKQNKSMTKLNTGKNEDKMIENLRGIQ